jgi:hypothetical protein
MTVIDRHDIKGLVLDENEVELIARLLRACRRVLAAHDLPVLDSLMERLS